MNTALAKHLFSLLLFGSNGIVASRIALSSYEIVFLRCLLGSLLLGVIVLAARKPLGLLREKRSALFIAASGVAMGASWMFLYEAFTQIGVSFATLTYYCGPVILMALSPLLFKERLTRVKLTALAMVATGAALLNGPLALNGSTWGLFCGAMAALCYVVMVVFNKKASGVSGMENTLLQLAAALVTVTVFLLWRQGLRLDIAAADWPPILVLGLLNTGYACWLYFSSIGRLPVQTVAVCGYMEPLSAVLFSVALLGETMTPWQMLGALLIFSGAMLGELRRSKN
ncbi:DMT family transporter [Mailhella sp.]|uniref:DMT family transporter n=1 Tax=Mailhella sp. TaxID=1981029 RepID=UPI00406318C6